MKRTLSVTLATVLLVVCLFVVVGAASAQTSGTSGLSQTSISENGEWGILILPTKGKRIHALQEDLEKYRDAQTESEKDMVLQGLLTDPNNKIVEMAPTEEPSNGGSTETVAEMQFKGVFESVNY